MSGKFYKLTMNDVPLAGKTVLVRADYNVPLTADGKVADDYRIRMSVPTIKKLIADECRVVIISHLGRPEGQVNPKYSLTPVAARLSELLGQPVEFVDDCVGQKVFMQFGQRGYASPSRFLEDMGYELMQRQAPVASQSQDYNEFDEFVMDFDIGDRVRSRQFGDGEIVDIDGLAATIEFDNGVRKKLNVEYARLEKL